MRVRRPRASAFLVAALLVLGFVAGTAFADRARALPSDEPTRLAHAVSWPGALAAVLRSDGERGEGLVSTRKTSAAGLLVLLAGSLCGLDLRWPSRARRIGPARGAPLALTRVRLGVGLRAPPSSSSAVA